MIKRMEDRMDEGKLRYVFFKMKFAVARAMRYVESEQVWNPMYGGVPMKRDQPAEGYYGASLLTRVDAESSRILFDALCDIADVKILSKNGTQGQGRYSLLVDPCDGSLPLLQGLLTSTIILGLLDPDGMHIATVVGDPISGRMWCASGWTNTTVQVISPNHVHGQKHSLGIEHPVRVWQGLLSSRSTCFIDRARGHYRDARQILTDADAVRMVSTVPVWSGILMLGSNGMHHALVANGGERVAGSITTAMGGAWDACGALLVTQAGGVARAFKICGGRLCDDHADPLLAMCDDRHLVEIDPLRPLDYDIIVVGNSPRTVETLIMCVTGARTPNI